MSNVRFQTRLVAETTSSCVILVPTHKEKCSEFELKSLKNTLEIFNKRDVVVLLPYNISRKFYEELPTHNSFMSYYVH